MLKFCGCVTRPQLRWPTFITWFAFIMSFSWNIHFFCLSLDMFCKINDNDSQTKIPRAPTDWANKKNKYITQIWNQFWWGCCCCYGCWSLIIEKFEEFFGKTHKTMAFLILHRDTEPIWSENYLVSVSSCGVALHKWIHSLTSLVSISRLCEEKESERKRER